MRAWMLLVACALVIAGCIAPEQRPTDLPGAVNGPTGHPLEGTAAPAYQAVDMAGAPVSLQDLEGQPVLLHIWASWCTVCEAEEPAMDALHARYGDRVHFVAVSIDSERYEDAMRAEAVEWDYDNWWDPEDTIRPLFQVSYQPVTVFIDENGTIDSVWQGQRADRTTLRAEQGLAQDILERLLAP